MLNGEKAAEFDASGSQTVTLLNLLYAPTSSPLHALGQVLMRLESPSHILVWTKVRNDCEKQPGRDWRLCVQSATS